MNCREDDEDEGEEEGEDEGRDKEDDAVSAIGRDALLTELAEVELKKDEDEEETVTALPDPRRSASATFVSSSSGRVSSRFACMAALVCFSFVFDGVMMIVPTRSFLLIL